MVYSDLAILNAILRIKITSIDKMDLKIKELE